MTLIIPNADKSLLDVLNAINEKIVNPYEIIKQENQDYELDKKDIQKLKNILEKEQKGELKLNSLDEVIKYTDNLLKL